MNKRIKRNIKILFYLFIFFEIFWQILNYRTILFSFLTKSDKISNNEDEISLNFNYLILKLNKDCEFTYKKIFYFKLDNCFQYSPGEVVKISSLYSKSANEGYYKKKLIIRNINVIETNSYFLDILKKIAVAFLKYSENIRVLLLEVINTNLNHKSSSLMISLILGKNNLSVRQSGDDFLGLITNLGLAHLTAISGYHLNVFVSMIKKVVFFFNKKVNNLLVLFFLVFYLSLTGLSPSLLRSSFMVLIAILTKVYLGRQYNSLFSLLNIFFILLSINLFYIFDLAFQLSFLATLGIILYFRIFKNINLKKEEIFLSKKRQTKSIVSFFVENIYFLFFLNLFIWPVIFKSFSEYNFLVLFISLPVSILFSFLIKYSYFLFFLFLFSLFFSQVNLVFFEKIYENLVFLCERVVVVFSQIEFLRFKIFNFNVFKIGFWYLLLTFFIFKLTRMSRHKENYYYLSN